MDSVKRLALGGLLIWSFLCGTAAVTVLLEPDVTADSRRGILTASAILGIPGLIGSAVLARGLKQQSRQQMRQQLQAAFLAQLDQGQGQVALMPFALAAGVSATEARGYLDQQLRQFDGEFAVTEQGEMLYCFERSLARSLPNTGLAEPYPRV